MEHGKQVIEQATTRGYLLTVVVATQKAALDWLLTFGQHR